MKKYTSIGLSLFILVSVIFSTLVWIRTFRQSIQTYRSPLREASLDPQSLTPRHTDKVVIILVSGLGYDNALALNLPALTRLSHTGANSAILSQPPTYAQTAWATLLSGALPELNDAPPVDLLRSELYELEVDTIFTRADEAHLQTALFGYADWQYLLPSRQLNYSFFVENRGPEADELILETALPVIKDNDTDLILVQFSQLDSAAKYQGGLTGLAYRQAADQINIYLEQISAAIDFSDTVLIVLADYGHIEAGGHGGAEIEVIWQPFIMVGVNIIPGDYSDIYQSDIAPTISALLGVPPPTQTQGRILSEMLRLSEYDQAKLQLSLAQQRVALANAYLARIEGSALSATSLFDDLTYAQTTFENNNVDGAFQLARLTRKDADAQIAATRLSRIRAGQIIRLIVTLLLVALWSIIIWRRQGHHAGSIVIAAAIAIGVYHTLYQLQGYSYSISSFTDFPGLPLDIARRTAVSLLVGGGFLLIFLLLANEGSGRILLGTAYGFSVLVTFVFALSFFWGYWQNGWAINLFLPAVQPLFWQITGAFESMMAAALGLLLPWPIMILAISVYFVRRRLTEPKRPRPKTGALPGLHL